MMKLENTSQQEIKTIVEAQRAFFRSGETLSLKFRQRALCALSKAMKLWESRIAEALWKDLHKSYEEAYMTELSIVLGEIDNHLHYPTDKHVFYRKPNVAPCLQNSVAYLHHSYKNNRNSHNI